MPDIDLQTYQQIFDMIPVGLGIAAMTGKLLIWNKAILEPGGYESKDIEALNSVVELYFDPADREKVMGIAKQDGQVTDFKVRFKRKNGDAYWTLMSLKHVEFAGQPGWLASVVDIEKQVKAESELQKKLDEIEQMNKLMVGRELKMVELKEQLEKDAAALAAEAQANPS